MAKAQKQGGKKGRKINRQRDSVSNKRYKAENRKENNKTKKILKHLKRHPGDLQTANSV